MFGEALSIVLKPQYLRVLSVSIYSLLLFGIFLISSGWLVVVPNYLLTYFLSCYPFYPETIPTNPSSFAALRSYTPRSDGPHGCLPLIFPPRLLDHSSQPPFQIPRRCLPWIPHKSTHVLGYHTVTMSYPEFLQFQQAITVTAHIPTSTIVPPILYPLSDSKTLSHTKRTSYFSRSVNLSLRPTSGNKQSGHRRNERRFVEFPVSLPTFLDYINPALPISYNPAHLCQCPFFHSSL